MMNMNRIVAVCCLMVFAGCAREKPSVEILSVRFGPALADGRRAAPGRAFVEIHARHRAETIRCDVDHLDMVLIDAQSVSHRVRSLSETSGESASTRPFGLGEWRTVHPHEIRAVFDVPDNLHATHLNIGGNFPTVEFSLQARSSSRS